MSSIERNAITRPPPILRDSVPSAPAVGVKPVDPVQVVEKTDLQPDVKAALLRSARAVATKTSVSSPVEKEEMHTASDTPPASSETLPASAPQQQKRNAGKYRWKHAQRTPQNT